MAKSNNLPFELELFDMQVKGQPLAEVLRFIATLKGLDFQNLIVADSWIGYADERRTGNHYVWFHPDNASSQQGICLIQSNEGEAVPSACDTILFRRNSKGGSEATLLFVDARTKTNWMTTLKIDDYIPYHPYGGYYRRPSLSADYELSEWKPCKKLLSLNNVCLIQSQSEIDLLRLMYPYAYMHLRQQGYVITRASALRVILAPQLEQLDKSGFVFAKKLINNEYDLASIDAFNRLCQPGRNLKEIFKTSKPVYQALKDEYKISVWDVFRKMDKFGVITKDTVEQVYKMDMREEHIEMCRKILQYEWNGQKLFSWDSLQRYLQKIDQYEAINLHEGLPLLRDYLNSCKFANMKPRIDADSLKREHDVAARICRNKRDEKLAADFSKACKNLQSDNFENGAFIIRAFKDYDDLIDEATQQRNCIASYAKWIMNGDKLIYVLRRKVCPELSYVTLELSKDKKHVVEKRLAANRSVNSQAVTDFLKDWLKELEIREKTKAANTARQTA